MGIELVTTLFFIFHLVNGDIIVQTESGLIRGKNVGEVDEFLGIPYAEPPVGHLRFAKPVPKTPWSEEYDVTNYSPVCVQMNLIAMFTGQEHKMSEDCLYLNLWVPVKRSPDELKAVMFFIHGGGFMMGTASDGILSGANLAEHGDVIVVTINYRVGAFGFFTGLTEDSPGSQGLYDQVLAMQWVKDNAKHFGGNPDNIVIFGESAGAFSVSMHQVSPLSKNLFKRAILQSGTSINPLYSRKNERISQISTVYASMLGCTKKSENWLENPSNTIDCLRSVPAEKFPEVDSVLFKNDSGILLPRIGNDFLPDSTIDMFKEGQFKESEVLMGITRDEGTMFITVTQFDILGFFGEKVTGEMFNETTAYNVLKRKLGNSDSDEDEKIIRSYLDDINDEKGYLNVLSEALGDHLITCGQIFQAEYQSMRGIPVYFYMFDHRKANSPFPEWMGVPHCDELQYVFGNPMFVPFSEQEEELSRDIMDMWTTFAKTGNPTIPGSVPWPRYSFEDPKYLIIGKRDKIGTRPDHNRCERWRNRFQSAIDESIISTLKKN